MIPADASKPNGETYVIVPAALLAAHSDELTSPADDPAWGDDPPDELAQAAAVMTTATNAKPFTAPFRKFHLRFTPTSSRSLCAPRVGVYQLVGVAELCQASRRRWTRTTMTNRAMPMMAMITTDA